MIDYDYHLIGIVYHISILLSIAFGTKPTEHYGRRSMDIGLRRGTVAVVQHRAEWETAAEQTVGLLRDILGDTAADVQHVGSTAVKTICAKPIIDIAVGVPVLDDILGFNDVLAENGFIFRGQNVPEQYLYVCGTDDVRTHHIHVVSCGSEAWENYVNMRDYLNCHAEEAQAYSALKQRLAEQYPNDRAAYTAMKSEMIGELLRRARQWRGVDIQREYPVFSGK